MELKTMRFRGVTVDKCFNCHGSWFDAHELEVLAGHEGPGLLERIAAVFRPDKTE
jgi:Zn-finger nucleic acid-binding protein